MPQQSPDATYSMFTTHLENLTLTRCQLLHGTRYKPTQVIGQNTIICIIAIIHRLLQYLLLQLGLIFQITQLIPGCGCAQ